MSGLSGISSGLARARADQRRWEAQRGGGSTFSRYYPSHIRPPGGAEGPDGGPSVIFSRGVAWGGDNVLARPTTDTYSTGGDLGSSAFQTLRSQVESYVLDDPTFAMGALMLTNSATPDELMLGDATRMCTLGFANYHLDKASLWKHLLHEHSAEMALQAAYAGLGIGAGAARAPPSAAATSARMALDSIVKATGANMLSLALERSGSIPHDESADRYLRFVPQQLRWMTPSRYRVRGWQLGEGAGKTAGTTAHEGVGGLPYNPPGAGASVGTTSVGDGNFQEILDQLPSHRVGDPIYLVHARMDRNHFSGLLSPSGAEEVLYTDTFPTEQFFLLCGDAALPSCIANNTLDSFGATGRLSDRWVYEKLTYINRRDGLLKTYDLNDDAKSGWSARAGDDPATIDDFPYGMVQAMEQGYQTVYLGTVTDERTVHKSFEQYMYEMRVTAAATNRPLVQVHWCSRHTV